METEEIKENRSLPNWDGRQEYFKVLKSYMMALAQAQIGPNYELRLDILSGMYLTCCSWMDPKDCETIERSIDNIRHNLGTLNNSAVGSKNRSLLKNKIAKDLFYLNKTVNMAAKDLMLKGDKEENLIFDDKEFMRGSDL